MNKCWMLATLAWAAAGAQAVTLLDKGFKNVGTLATAGWVQTNLSNPVGLGWGQGFVSPFAAQAGSAIS